MTSSVGGDNKVQILGNPSSALYLEITFAGLTAPQQWMCQLHDIASSEMNESGSYSHTCAIRVQQIADIVIECRCLYNGGKQEDKPI